MLKISLNNTVTLLFRILLPCLKGDLYSEVPLYLQRTHLFNALLETAWGRSLFEFRYICRRRRRLYFL